MKALQNLETATARSRGDTGWLVPVQDMPVKLQVLSTSAKQEIAEEEHRVLLFGAPCIDN